MTQLAYILTSGAFFIMLYFSISIARFVHSTLGPENAGKLLRVLFPKYFLWGLFLSIFSTLIFYFSNKIFESVTLLIVALLAGISRFILVPKINKNRDLMIQGEATSKKAFSSLHTLSVMINFFQMILLLMVLIKGVI
tara:strand:+ start:421 stop:834 length:414 start_codon:yes stop_codon:yes gene_type:complete